MTTEQDTAATEGAWVVMKAVAGATTLWAWGRVTSGGPGFEDVFYTKDDGFSPAESVESVRLTEHLFTVHVPFERPGLSPTPAWRPMALMVEPVK